MKIRISHGAGHGPGSEDWFVVQPLQGHTRPSVVNTPITHDMAVMSLLAAGRAVYELDLPDGPDDDPDAPLDGTWQRVTLTP